MNYKVLSTRKLTPELHNEARQHGIDLIEEEFIRIKPLLTEENRLAIKGWIDDKENIAAIFTSSNAVDIASGLLKANEMEGRRMRGKICCLTGATLRAAQEKLSGCQVMVTGTDSADLAKNILAMGISSPLLFFCGNKRRDELPAALKDKGKKFNELVIYETVETPARIAVTLDAILFFTPSAVQSFFSVNKAGNKTVCFAIGNTTARAIAGHTGNKVITCTTPDQELMMKELWVYFQNNNRQG